MPYATLKDITDRYGETDLLVAADRDGDDRVDTPAVNRAVRDASAEIDTYLAARYTLPLATPPSVLKRLCVDISLYRLAFNALGNTEERRQRYQDAVALLLRISKGDVSLGVGKDKDAKAASKGKGAVIKGPVRRFSRTAMKGLS